MAEQEFSEHSDSNSILNTTFKTLLGKIFCPNNTLSCVILALENGAKENNEILDYVDRFYIRKQYKLGETLSSQN